ncbi:hypothetical protein Tco_0938748 [Tanacetum coccineum]|uniref:Uncharacterized protein n=1 Tax=Tanacetum coccineum TaxID=301880 RepID=A0ABQ5DJW1_9ASTR
MEEICDTLSDKVALLTISTSSDLLQEALPRLVVDDVKKERELLTAVVPTLISQEFVAHVPKIIEELFRIHMQNTILNVHPTTSTSTTTTSDL